MRTAIAAVFFTGFLLGLPGSETKPEHSLPSTVQESVQTPESELAEALRLEAMAVQFHKEGKYGKALPLAKRVVDIREKVLGAEHLLVATSLYDLALLSILTGKHNKAEQLLERVIGIREKALGSKHADLGKTLEQYACYLWSRDKRDKAEKIESRIGEILYNAKDVSNPQDLTKGKALSLPQPYYPEEAKRARLGGTIIVWVTIDETGRVIQSSGRCGDPSLIKVSEEAAQNARFKPTMLSGKPISVVGYLIYNFVPR